MNYLLLIYVDPAAGPAPETPEAEATHQAEQMAEAGVSLAGKALQPTTTATTVRAGEGETLTLDGPFAETKEVLGGFYLVDVPDLDAALAWAAKAPHLAFGSVEVRPVMDLG